MTLLRPYRSDGLGATILGTQLRNVVANLSSEVNYVNDQGCGRNGRLRKRPLHGLRRPDPDGFDGVFAGLKNFEHVVR